MSRGDSCAYQCAGCVLHCLNVLDFCFGVSAVLAGVLVLIRWHLSSAVYLWMPFFGVGGLLLFMVATSTCAVNCPMKTLCPNCCIFFSDFLAFIVMAAEVLLGVITFAFKDFAKKQMEEVRHKMKNDKDCDTHDSGGCNPELIKQMEGWLLYIAIGSFVAAGLQLVRLLAGRGLRSKSPRERFPSNVQWEQAYDDMRTNSTRSTPYERIHGNAGPRDPNAV